MGVVEVTALGTRGRIAAWSILDAAHRPSARSALDVPWHPDAIAAHWFDAVLADPVPDAHVTSIEMLGGDEGSSCRRRIRILWNAAGQAAGLPSDVFTKSAPSFAMRLSGGVAAATEGRFLMETAPALPLETPRCWYARRDPETGRAMQVMDDLTVTRGAHFFQLPGVVDVKTAMLMMQSLARLHGTFLSGRLPVPDWLATYPDFFKAATRAGIGEAHHKAMHVARDVLPPGLHGRGDEIWAACIRQLEVHAHEPGSVIHSDVHPGNWYVTAEGEPGLCDWARVCRGHWARDVAYALSTLLGVEERRREEDRLLQTYAETMSEFSGQRSPVAEVRAAMRQQLCAALLMWTPTLCPPPTLPAMQPAEVSLEMIRRIAAAIGDHDAVEA